MSPREWRLRLNVIVHEYFRLNVAILWQTITQNLPPLVPLLEELLARDDPTAS